MSQQGSFTIGSGLRLAVVVVAAIIGAAISIPASLVTACAIGVGVLSFRRETRPASPPAPVEINPFRQIEVEALRDRVGALEEALDHARHDIISLADIAAQVPPQRAGEAVSRIAQLTGLLQQESESISVGDVLAHQLGEGPPGWWVLESELPTVRSLPALVGELLNALVEVTESSVGQVRCAGSTRVGLGLIEVSFIASEPMDQIVGFHVARRAAELLGGGMWERRVGAEDRLLVAIPLDYFPSLRLTSEPAITFGLL